MDLYKAEVRTLHVNIFVEFRFLYLFKYICFHFKEFVRVLRLNNPTISNVFERVENDEILR